MSQIRRKGKSVLIVFIVVLVICFLPIPIKIEREMQGLILNEQGEYSQSILIVDGVYCYSVLLTDLYDGKLCLLNTPFETGERHQWIPFRRTESPFVRCAGLIYFGAPDTPGGVMYVDGLFSEVLVMVNSDTYYVYPANNVEEAKSVLERIREKAYGITR